ncbi:MAG TPA: hypothetical protein VLL95_04110, partial [Phnomibacter sp.]|nr:hypothetical protein [Phnomibacter sp.]
MKKGIGHAQSGHKIRGCDLPTTGQNRECIHGLSTIPGWEPPPIYPVSIDQKNLSFAHASIPAFRPAGHWVAGFS